MFDPKKSLDTNIPTKRAQTTTLGTSNANSNLLNAPPSNSPVPSSSVANLNSSGSVNNLTIMNMPNVLKLDKQNLISVGLIGALTNNGHSTTAAQIPILLAQADDSSFNKRLLSRYGCYLIINLIDPSEFGEMVSLF